MEEGKPMWHRRVMRCLLIALICVLSVLVLLCLRFGGEHKLYHLYRAIVFGMLALVAALAYRAFED